MVTFEDFFAKKKIDLQALQHDNPELYMEFQQHYHAMGEKSFDHTKKFWFNRLRKSYKLNEPEPSIQKTEVAIKSTAVPASSSLGFKPKFKATTAPTIAEDRSEGMEKEQATPAEEHKPTGFKPRFRAGVTKTEATPPEDIQNTSAIEEPSSKPSGFKPRFKAGVTKSVEQEEKPQTSPDSEQTTPTPENKPTGFKPRFKAGVTKMETTSSESAPDVPASEEPSSKPSGFKPRFKAGVTKAVPPKNTTPETNTPKEDTSTEN